MREVWVFGTSRQATAEISDGLSELGLEPHHVPADEPLPPSRNGTRRPALAVVVTAREDEAPRAELVERLAGTDDLEGIGILLVVDPSHLRAHAHLDPACELLVRPFSFAELRARVARASRAVVVESEASVVRAGALELDPVTYRVTIEGRPISFANMEYELLRFLMTHPNRVFSREALLRRVWSYDYDGGARTIDVHVRRVRAKLGQEQAWRLKTVRGVGYLFELPEATARPRPVLRTGDAALCHPDPGR